MSNRCFKVIGIRNIYFVVFILIFFCVLIAPITKINKEDKSKQENRKLANKPSIFIQGRLNRNYGKEFDAWLSDRFRGRIKLVNAYTKFNKWAVGRLENSRAMKGKDGFLFYKGDNSVANYQNKKLYSENELQRIKNNIFKRKELLAEYGIQYYVMIAPDKNRVYGENYPPYIGKYHDYGRAEQLYNYLLNNGIKVVYPREEILRNKVKGVLYYRLDTHWNTYGAFLGYNAMMQEISKYNKDIKYMQLECFDIKNVPEHGGDLLGMLNVKVEDVGIPENSILSLAPKNKYSYKYLKNEGTKGVETVNTEPLINKRLYMLRDSFTSAMEPYFSNTFAHSTFVWSHDFNGNYENIVKAKPDIVIQEMVERYSGSLLSDNPPLLTSKQEHSLDIKSFIPSNTKMSYYVDQQIDDNRVVIFKGWAFLNPKKTVKQKVYLANISNGIIRIFPCTSNIREDVGAHFKEPLCKYSGFAVKVKKQDIFKNGEFKLIVINENQIVYSSEIKKY